MPHSACASRRVSPGSAATYASMTSTAAIERDPRAGEPATCAAVPVDYTFLTRVEHRPGQLARVLEAVADAGGLVGELRTCKLTRSYSERELTVAVADDAGAEALRESLDAIDTVEV